MRPKLKGDTYYFPTPDGIYLRNNLHPFYLKGKGLARLLDILSPHLNGEYSLDEILANLPADRQELLKKLIQILVAKNFLQDVSTDLPHQLSKQELHAYDAEIAFIGSFTSSAAYHFEQYRNARVLLIGSGLTLTALVHAALHSGLRQVHVLLTDECPTDRQRLADYLELYCERDGQQEISFVDAPAWTNKDALRLALQPFDAFLHVTDRTMAERAYLLNHLAYEQQKPLIQAVLVDDEARIGPLVQPGKAGCWECAWRRLHANNPSSSAFDDTPSGAVSRFVAAPTAAVVANLLNFELFKYLAGVEALETAEHLLIIDLETLQCNRHAFAPHPLCSTCSSPVTTLATAFQETIEQLRAAPVAGQEYFSDQATQLFDTRSGLFHELDEYDFTQIPLNVCQVSFIQPQTALLRKVIGWGTDFGAARRHATFESCKLYAAHFYDARRGLAKEALQSSLAQSTGPAPRVYNQQLRLTDLPGAGATQEHYLWTWDLAAQTLAAVNASAVFPTAQEDDFSPHCDLIGVGAGASWEEAISFALLTHVRAQCLRSCNQATAPFPRVNLDQIGLQPEGERLQRLLGLVRADLAIYNLSASAWGFPCFAFCLAGTTVAYACDYNLITALQAGLEQTLFAQQAKDDHRIYEPEPVSNLPLILRGSEEITPSMTNVPNLAEQNTLLLSAFTERGFIPLVIPLDHDPALAKVLPFLVKIVLGEARSERGA